jgi:hypothetical protein
MPTTASAPVTPEVEEEEEKIAEPVLTFPPNSPFVPPTNPPLRPQAISSSSSTSTTKSRTTSTTPAVDIDPPMAKDVIMDNTGNKVVLGGGFGGSFSVNQPSSIQDGCRGRCNKEKSEICVYAHGQHECLCRPGYSRADPLESCTSKFHENSISVKYFKIFSFLFRNLHVPTEISVGKHQQDHVAFRQQLKGRNFATISQFGIERSHGLETSADEYRFVRFNSRQPGHGYSSDQRK